MSISVTITENNDCVNQYWVSQNTKMHQYGSPRAIGWSKCIVSTLLDDIQYWCMFDVCFRRCMMNMRPWVYIINYVTIIIQLRLTWNFVSPPSRSWPAYHGILWTCQGSTSVVNSNLENNKMNVPLMKNFDAVFPLSRDISNTCMAALSLRFFSTKAGQWYIVASHNRRVLRAGLWYRSAGTKPFW